ncbi:8-amino-7-oxononanoate synthase [Ensifer sp. M14]|nr:8-amino-7-oxononanoate synthase [Ensifer sp. M14]
MRRFYYSCSAKDTSFQSPLHAIVELKDHQKFLLFGDEVHSFGLHRTRTLNSKLGITDKVDFVMTIPPKGTGPIGGGVATSHVFKTRLQVETNALLFQAATLPADVAAIIASTEMIEETPEILSSFGRRSPTCATGYAFSVLISEAVPVRSFRSLFACPIHFCKWAKKCMTRAYTPLHLLALL